MYTKLSTLISNSSCIIILFSNQEDKYDYTIIALNPNHIPKPTSGEERIRFPLNAYEGLGDSRLKEQDNVYLIHYPEMEGECARRESAYLVQFSSGKYVEYTRRLRLCPVSFTVMHIACLLYLLIDIYVFLSNIFH